MSAISAGARHLPPHHVTIRVPWHDGGWAGTVYARPLDNSSRLILPRIGERRRDEVEARCAGRRFYELDRADLPPRVSEHVSFIHGSLRAYADDDAPVHGGFPRVQDNVL